MAWGRQPRRVQMGCRSSPRFQAPCGLVGRGLVVGQGAVVDGSNAMMQSNSDEGDVERKDFNVLGGDGLVPAAFNGHPLSSCKSTLPAFWLLHALGTFAISV